MRRRPCRQRRLHKGRRRGRSQWRWTPSRREASLEDQIQELKTMAKAFRGINTPPAKAQLDQWDGELMALTKRQKKARPLLARLQAATARLTKAKATQEEVDGQVAELQD